MLLYKKDKFTIEEEELILSKTSTDDLFQYEVTMTQVMLYLSRHNCTPTRIKRILPKCPDEAIPTSLIYPRAMELFTLYSDEFVALKDAQIAITAHRLLRVEDLKGVCVATEKTQWCKVRANELLYSHATLINEHQELGVCILSYAIDIVIIDRDEAPAENVRVFASTQNIVECTDPDLWTETFTAKDHYKIDMEVHTRCTHNILRGNCSCDIFINTKIDIMPMMMIERLSSSYAERSYTELLLYGMKSILREIDHKDQGVYKNQGTTEIEVLFVSTSNQKFQQVRDFFDKKHERFKVNIVQVEETIPEYQLTVEEIAAYKASHYRRSRMRYMENDIIMTDDTSLEIECLNGFPGPYVKHQIQSAGLHSLYDMAGETKRAAVIVAIALTGLDSHITYIFKGVEKGTLVWPPRGQGYSFDDIFVPNRGNTNKTISQLEGQLSRETNPRIKALRKAYRFLWSRYKR